MFGVQNTIKVLIGKSLTRTSATTVTSITDPTAANYIQDGEILLLATGATGGSSPYIEEPYIAGTHAPTANMLLRFVQRSGDKLTFSPFFKKKNLVKYLTTTYVDYLDQVSYVGYEGGSSTNGITVTNNNNYILTITNTFDDKVFAEQLARRIYSYTSSASATQSAIAKSFVNQINADQASFVKAYVTGDAATAVATTGSGTVIKLTNGSKTGKFYIGDATAGLVASTGTVASGAVLNVPTDNVRSFSFSPSALGSGAGRHVVAIGGTIYNVADAGDAAANGTAIVAAINAGTQATASGTTTVTVLLKECFNGGCYPLIFSTPDDAAFTQIVPTVITGDAVPTKVTVTTGATTAATFTLDTEFVGQTGFFVVGTAVASAIGVSTDTDFGIKLVGKPLDYKAKGLFPYKRVSFEVSTMNFGTTAVNTTAMVNGTGTYEQVADLEWFALGGDGIRNYMWHPIPEGRTDAVTCTKYDTIALSYINEDPVEVISGRHPSEGQIYLFYVSGAAQETTMVTDLADAFA